MPRGEYTRTKYNKRLTQNRIPKTLSLIIENYIAREKYLLKEMKGKRITSTVWHASNQEAFIKGMLYIGAIINDVESFDTTWSSDEVKIIDIGKTFTLRV